MTVTVVRTVAEYRALRRTLTGVVGLVPTMGCLHRAHMALVQLCGSQCDHVVITIFVNPAQFAPTDDFDSYPRQVQKDVALIEEQGLSSVIVFTPDQKEMYPDPCPPHPSVPQTTIPAAYVDVERFVEGKAEAVSRKGFFTGVATVCVKLFNITAPDLAVFGKKDRLQCYVIERVVRDLCLPIRIVLAETTREPNGLAMSSRNEYLSPEQRADAGVIFAALTEGQRVCSSGKRSVKAVAAAVVTHLQTLSGLEILYVAVSDRGNMTDLDPEAEVPPTGAVLSCAVRYGPARLIDNVDL